MLYQCSSTCYLLGKEKKYVIDYVTVLLCQSDFESIEKSQTVCLVPFLYATAGLESVPKIALKPGPTTVYIDPSECNVSFSD